MAKGYSELPNEVVSAANGVDYAYRDAGGGEGGVPLVLLQHFRGNLDSWDPALIDALAPARRVVTFDNAGVGGGSRPRRHMRGGHPMRSGIIPGGHDVSPHSRTAGGFQ
jgi:pimeloyl-ACP methyl ester carboxylesterase